MFRGRSIFIVSLLGVLICSGSSRAQSDAKTVKDAIAVMPLAGSDEAGIVAGLRSALSQRGEHHVLDAASTQEKISGAADLGLRCSPGDVPCLAKLGVLADLHFVLAPVLSARPEGVSIVLILIDVAHGSEVRRVSRPYTADKTAPLDQALKDALAELFHPESYAGFLQIDVEQVGAEISLDGTVLGKSPLPEKVERRPGSYALTVVLEPFPPHQATVHVRNGETLMLTVNLDGAPEAESATPPSAPVGNEIATDLLVLGAGAATAASTITAVLSAAGALAFVYVYLNCASPPNASAPSEPNPPLICIPGPPPGEMPGNDYLYPTSIRAPAPNWAIGLLVVFAIAVPVATASAITLAARVIMLATNEE